MRITPQPMELAPANRTDAARIDHVARQLEGQFAQMLVKSMRDASFGDALFPGENQTFRDMYDQQLAKALTEGRGLGLAPLIARQLARQAGTGTEAGAPLDTRLPGASAGAQQPGPTRAAAAALAYAREGGQPNLGLPAYERALDVIAGRPAEGADRAGEDSPMDSLVRRLMAGPQAGLQPAGQAAGPSAADEAAAAEAAASFSARSPERFVASIWNQAKAAARELGVDARALVAQAALETGWGRRQIQRADGSSANNLFGIKATGWKGERATSGTHEYVNGVRRNETADFRAYGSAAESFADYVRMLKNNPRYAQALKSGGGVKQFAQALQRAGYATDPSYADKIAAIANGPTLNRAVQAIASISARTAADAASTAVASAASALGAPFRR
jgi:flagellar protein FlgJ